MEPESSSTGAPRPSLRRASTEPIRPPPSSDYRHQPAAANNAAAPPPPGGGAPATANARVARPPLNPYLRIAIVRGDDDLVTFDDLENPGEKRSVPVGRLVDEDRDRKRRRRAEEKKKEREGEGKSDTAAETESSLPSLNDGDDENDASKSKNKKEIAVPSITEVKRYETDVPDNHPVPASYVRYRFPTYDDVHGGTVDYTADRDDEAWLEADGDFGSNSRARVVWGPPEDGKKRSAKEEADGNGGNEAKPADKQQTTVNANKAAKKPRLGKKLPTKKSKKQQPAAVKSEGGGDKEAISASADFNSEEGEPAGEGTTPTIHEVILSNPVYLHSRLTTRQLVARYRPRLPLSVLERMIDRLEKATGFGFVVGKDAARTLLAEKVPELEDVFGPLDDDERRLAEEEETAHVRRVLAMRVRPRTDPNGGGRVPRLVPPIPLASVIDRVYDYWVEKRTRLRRPLLRRYKPPVAASDTNPHVVFRQRDVTSRRRLRKKRSDDVESYRKLRQLKVDFENVKTLCRLVRAREVTSRLIAECSDEYFEARLHDRLDTTGLPRKRPDGLPPLTAERIEAVLSSVPRVYDDGPIQRTRGNKKRRRGGHHQPSALSAGGGGLSSSVHSICSEGELGFSSRGPSPVPPAAAGAAGGNKRGRKGNSSSGAAASKSREPSPAARRNNKVVVAGHDGGYPAPNFLQPLPTRGNPFGNMSLHGDLGPSAPASIPSYVDGKLFEDPESYTHRPRLGRGGRIVVDRVPRPSAAFLPARRPPAVVTYGAPMARTGYDLSDLGVDNPGYSAAGAAAGSPGSKPAAPAGGRSTRFGPSGVVTGCDARTAPKAGRASSLSDLVRDKFDDPGEVSRRIELICARGLVSDCQDSAAAAAAKAAGGATSKGRGGAGDAASSASAAIAARGAEEILVPLDDWSEAPEGTYGRERFVIGPI